MDSTFAPVISLLILFGLPQEVPEPPELELTVLAVEHGARSQGNSGVPAGEDRDEDGIMDGIDLCPGTPTQFPVDENGCTVDTDGDGISDGMDRCPGTRELAVGVDIHGCSARDRKLERSHRYLLRLS